MKHLIIFGFMKPASILFFLFVACYSQAQNITLLDLESICNKTNWEAVNNILSAKGWEYSDSEEGSSVEYSSITWAYERDRYTDEALAWITLYTYDEEPVRVSYQVFSEKKSSVVKNGLSSQGYKLEDSEILDDEILTNYASSKFILVVSASMVVDEYSYDGEHTSYSFLITKKSSIYDPDNGEKIEYLDDGEWAVYTLKNGEIDGAIKIYNDNEVLVLEGTYKNGKKNGEFKEYNEDGQIIEEYVKVNDEFSGLSKSYGYDNGRLVLKITGNYLNDKETGKWLYYGSFDDFSEPYQEFNYLDGELNGYAKQLSSDSLIECNYLKGLLHGEYRVKILQGDYFLDSEHGTYSYGQRTGHWIEFLFGAKHREGDYLSGLKSGIWKEYSIMDREGLLLKEDTYSSGELNGVSYRYFDVEITEPSESPDGSYKYAYLPIEEKCNYRNDLLNGECITKDSNSRVVEKGSFENGKRTGEWYYINISDDGLEHKVKVNFLEDRRRGPYKSFSMKDDLEVEGQYFDDEKTGEWSYYIDGRKDRSEVYNFGEFEQLNYWNDQGFNYLQYFFKYDEVKKIVLYDEDTRSERFRTTVESRKGNVFTILVRMVNGDTISSINYRTSPLNGILLYDSFLGGTKNGDYKISVKDEVIIQGKYDNGKLVGKWNFQHKEQNVSLDITYTSDEKAEELYRIYNSQELFDGEFIVFDAYRRKIESRKIKEGVRNGNTLFFDESGNARHKEKYKDGVKI